jgi:hypothetical protein
MSKPIYYVALLLMLFQNTLSSGQSEIVIPMDLTLNRPVIEIFINQSGPYQFIFDTGASGHVIDQDLASRLDLKETGKVEIGAPGSDQTSSAPQVVVPEMKVSGQSFIEISMVAMPLRNMIPVDGIISFKAFSDFLIDINYPNKKIILTQGELSKDQENVIDLVPDCQILTVPIKTDVGTWNAHLDTGAPFSFSFPYAFKDQLKFKAPPVPMDAQSRTIGGTHQIWKAELDDRIKLADIIFDSPDIILSDRNNEYANIGYPILKDLIVTIDLKNELIQFIKTEAEDTQKEITQKNDPKGITGRYGNLRSVTLENGIYYSQRDGSIKLTLVEVGDNLYEVQLPGGFKAKNELPKIRFERDGSERVIGLSLLYPDGKEEFSKKDDVSE